MFDIFPNTRLEMRRSFSEIRVVIDSHAFIDRYLEASSFNVSFALDYTLYGDLQIEMYV